LLALKAIWTKDLVEMQGTGFKISKSYFELKPVQKPHPPIYMAAYTPGAMKRAAREANGWFPVGVPLSAVASMFETIKGMVREGGRSPDSFELIIRGNLEFTPSPVDKDRANFTGTLEQIAEDIQLSRKVGASELVLDVQFSPDVQSDDDVLQKMEQLKRVAG
jgi:alkanesulfonate monooxygenase SsuD/methylene tetrahydromethanopterin reductase-like flavin-dependent oxidoreductase (luciferase family)